MSRLTLTLVLVVIVIVVLAGSIAIYFTRSQSVNTIMPCPGAFSNGHYSLYAGGSSTDCLFTIPRSGYLTGSFQANASLDFYVQTKSEFQQSSLGSIPTSYVYSLKNVSTETLDIPLTSGSFYIDFFFTYKYQIVSPINGTAYAGSTALNITKTFVVNLNK